MGEHLVPDVNLTPMQRQVLQWFFDLPESEGFVLAGGAALLALGLSSRPTQDIDLFSSDLEVGVRAAANALEAVVVAHGWLVEQIHDSSTFRRLVVRINGDEIVVDLAVDSPPVSPPTTTTVGTSYAADELAARKLLALFDRAEARDFVDMHTLSTWMDLEHLLRLAARLDSGFDRVVLAEALATHQRFTDDDFRALRAEPEAVRAFAESWRHQLSKGGEL